MPRPAPTPRRRRPGRIRSESGTTTRRRYQSRLRYHPSVPIAAATTDELAELDPDVEGDESQEPLARGQPELAQHPGEPESVEQAEEKDDRAVATSFVPDLEGRRTFSMPTQAMDSAMSTSTGRDPAASSMSSAPSASVRAWATVNAVTWVTSGPSRVLNRNSPSTKRMWSKSLPARCARIPGSGSHGRSPDPGRCPPWAPPARTGRCARPAQEPSAGSGSVPRR